MKSYLFHFHRLPDGDPPQGGGPLPKASVNRTPALPRKDDDIAVVALDIAKHWGTVPQITLIWKKQPDFASEAQKYADTLDNRKTAGGDKPVDVEALRELDRKIDKGVGSVKIDIMQKFTKEKAPAQYARYGIHKNARGYVLPAERSERLAALKRMLAAVTADGVGGADYGVSFWATMLADYRAAIAASTNNDGTISQFVKEKNALRETLLKVMGALQDVLRGNYPDNYEAVYREWGWQKEKY